MLNLTDFSVNASLANGNVSRNEINWKKPSKNDAEIRKVQIKSLQTSTHPAFNWKNANYFWVQCMCVQQKSLLFTREWNWCSCSIDWFTLFPPSGNRPCWRLLALSFVKAPLETWSYSYILTLWTKTQKIMKKVDSVTHFKLHRLYFWLN